MVVSVYELWLERNHIVFQNSRRREDIIMKDIIQKVYLRESMHGNLSRTNTHLGPACNVQIIQSVLFSIQTYWSQLFLLPRNHKTDRKYMSEFLMEWWSRYLLKNIHCLGEIVFSKSCMGLKVVGPGNLK
ncbi:hypothetical protein H5410_031352 [Solanum commersonii]|uniref:Uncharacterized protein n=1 Tax=Solanum commersonii TaxID=4109 RepID=A0A9J5YM23_SOLCO|nr:hypothetical protein H5410_031352 [Solanum commersonii]